MKQRIYQFEDFILDQKKEQLFFGDKPIMLTSKNFELLSILVENSHKIVEKKEIFDIIWSEHFVEESNLPVHISALRKLFKEYGCTKEFIKTVSGRGYIFTAQVKEILPIQLRSFNKSFAKISTTNTEAYDFYIKGQYIVETTATRINFESDLFHAIKFFDSAIRLDPNFVEAYVGNAFAVIYLYNYRFLSKEEAYLKCNILLAQGQLANSNISDIFFIEGLISFVFELNIPKAEKLLHKALELDSNNVKAIYWIGILNIMLNNLETAHLYLLKATELNPTNITIRTGILRYFYFSHDFNQAITEAKNILEMDSRSFIGLLFLSLSYARLGIFEEAVRYCNELTIVNILDCHLTKAYIHVLQNQPHEANNLLREILSDEKQICAYLYFIVLIYTAQNKIDEAFDLLFKYCDKADYDILMIKCDPGLESLQKDERFQIILKKLHLDSDR